MKCNGFFLSLALLAAIGAVASPRGTASGAPCRSSGLVVWTAGPGDGAAGSVYLTLGLTNQSGHACTLTGFPGVSAVDLQGKAMGRPASRDRSTIRTVRLDSGATAHVRLRIVNALNFPPSTCRPRAAAGLRVYPPGETTSKVVPIPFEACSRSGPVFLSVRAVA